MGKVKALSNYDIYNFMKRVMSVFMGMLNQDSMPPANMCGHLCIELCGRRLSNNYRLLSDTALAKTISVSM